MNFINSWRIDVNNQIEIQALNIGHSKGLSQLHFELYGNKISSNYYSSKVEIGLGYGSVGFVALSKGKLIANYSVFLNKKSLNSKNLLLAQSGDTMVSHLFQGKGLFKNLATKTYKALDEMGVSCVYGFPNFNSAPGFRSLGWVGLQRFSVSYLPRIPLFSKKNMKNTVFEVIPQSDFHAFLRVRDDNSYFHLGENRIYGVATTGLLNKINGDYCIFRNTQNSIDIGYANFSNIRSAINFYSYLSSDEVNVNAKFIRWISPLATFNSMGFYKLMSKKSGWYGYLPMKNYGVLNMDKASFSFVDIDVF